MKQQGQLQERLSLNELVRPHRQCHERRYCSEPILTRLRGIGIVALVASYRINFIRARGWWVGVVSTDKYSPMPLGIAAWLPVLCDRVARLGVARRSASLAVYWVCWLAAFCEGGGGTLENCCGSSVASWADTRMLSMVCTAFSTFWNAPTR